jgi:excisionase family DNA binding protein
MSSNDDKLLNTREAHVYMGIGRDCLFRLMREGRLPRIKIGRLTRIRASDIAAFLAANTEGARTNV